MNIERSRNAYPFCLPVPLSLPKKNYNKLFEHQRKEFRTNESLRREKMKEMIKEIEKNNKVLEKGEGGIGSTMKNLLKTERCSNCNKDNILGTFVYKCECCQAILCGDCVKKRKYQKKNEEIIDIVLCKYCDFIYIAVTEDIVFSNNIKQANEDSVYLLRCQIINTCISFMEEYSILNLFMKKLISSPSPREKDVKVCEDSLKIVKVKTQKVVSLQNMIDYFDTPPRKSDATIASNVIRAMNVFRRGVVFNSINEVKSYENLLQEIDAALDFEPEVIGISNTMLPLTGGTLSITLSSIRNIKVMINNMNIPFTTQGHTITFKAPPLITDQMILNIHLLHKDKEVPLPSDIIYFDIPKEILGQSSLSDQPKEELEKKVQQIEAQKEEELVKIISTIGSKHKIDIVECDESISDDDSSFDDVNDTIADDNEEETVLFSHLDKKDTEPKEVPNKSEDSQGELTEKCIGDTTTIKESNTIEQPKEKSLSPLITLEKKNTGNVLFRKSRVIRCKEIEEENERVKEEEKQTNKKKKADSSRDTEIKESKNMIEGLGDLRFATTSNVKISEEFGKALMRTDDIVKIDSVQPTKYNGSEPVLFTITGDNFGDEPIVYIGGKQVDVYEEISNTCIVGYLPYFKQTQVLDIVVEKCFGVKQTKENAILVEN
ncbi:hypothetical protein EHI8A_121260 [Entamoeba histolytica HM-1:IMSS-B]|uniref:IPT/TIG domain-containing protein n=5 Tax=Entamoeba histolytica TaxID=5759 RepID=C4M5S6_ENTH1|nr:hypothetical protein EHI_070800 [Entamoeba histolytica HM-1:IMSS]EMH75095.1 hypothetical protein EHI8A_121260 [Entamoeba histolytica HM-1:IMSS-B]EMS13312.1 hypothetical protein KM1_192710 [Entamoeba histolytica HM-3:IMSS]ENY59953.1 hypothetical protein EHI7A_110860 [Entamoeba histolytica HM-1:IMSS-A]GAT96800.1 hypothetical protein CL6EHI_070800 [Entamoeba histolytica]EAL49019.1 hypothetical protein EHI_070800 [Entamoeba histolytica HM-1:IMSS]|eukprot:XP_654411.1 hypothetical protein EHI_070800 [Entamoeba histolytica HM-1:IMSS]